jgi:hypothetical protein
MAHPPQRNESRGARPNDVRGFDESCQWSPADPSLARGHWRSRRSNRGPARTSSNAGTGRIAAEQSGQAAVPVELKFFLVVFEFVEFLVIVLVVIIEFVFVEIFVIEIVVEIFVIEFVVVKVFVVELFLFEFIIIIVVADALVIVVVVIISSEKDGRSRLLIPEGIPSRETDAGLR